MEAKNNTYSTHGNETGSSSDVGGVIRGVLVAAYVTILVGAFVGNSLVIHLVRTRVNIRKNPFNWLLVNTATADLLDVVAASAFSLPFFFCGDCWFHGWGGMVLCKVIPYILIVSVCVTILTLTVIAADRYLAIVCMQKEPLSSTSILGSIAGTWLFAGVLFSGEFYKFRLEETDDGRAECYPEWSEDSQYLSITLHRVDMVVRVVVTYAIPLVFMTTVYSLIAWFLCRHKPPGYATQMAVIKQEKKTRSVIKMLVTVVTAFALGWLPVHVSHILVEFHKNVFNSIPIVLQWLFYWMAHANTAVHPWLFINFSENFREETKRILRNILCMRRSNLQLSQAHGSTASQPSLFTTFEKSLPNSVPADSKASQIGLTVFDTKL